MPGTWKTKDDDELLISQLDDQHLINIARMLVRNKVAAKKAKIAKATHDRLRLMHTPYQHQTAEFLLYLKRSDPIALMFEQHNDIFQEIYDRDLTRFIPGREERMAIVEYFWEDEEQADPDLSEIIPDKESTHE